MFLFVVGISNDHMPTGIKALLCLVTKCFPQVFFGAKFAVQGQKPLGLALNAGWDVLRLGLISERDF